MATGRVFLSGRQFAPPAPDGLRFEEKATEPESVRQVYTHITVAWPRAIGNGTQPTANEAEVVVAAGGEAVKTTSFARFSETDATVCCLFREEIPIGKTVTVAARTANIVGWSEWSAPIPLEHPSQPVVPLPPEPMQVVNCVIQDAFVNPPLFAVEVTWLPALLENTPRATFRSATPHVHQITRYAVCAAIY